MHIRVQSPPLVEGHGRIIFRAIVQPPAGSLLRLSLAALCAIAEGGHRSKEPRRISSRGTFLFQRTSRSLPLDPDARLKRPKHLGFAHDFESLCNEALR